MVCPSSWVPRAPRLLFLARSSQVPFKESVFNLDEFPNMFVMAVGWITLQPFVVPFNCTMNGATHIRVSTALSCIVAGKVTNQKMGSVG